MEMTRAEAGIKKAWVAGIISGVFTLIVTAAAMAGYSFMGFSVWNLLDVAVIFGLTFGIYRKSRTCAVIMLIYFVGSKIFMKLRSYLVRNQLYQVMVMAPSDVIGSEESTKFLASFGLLAK